jgi:membrane protease YdiL (CAAX protease family)
MTEEKVPRLPPERGPVRAYLHDTRDLVASILYCVPLFVAYQIGVLSAGGVKNGVDFVTVTLLEVTDGDMGIYLALNAGVLVALLIAMFALRGRGRMNPHLFPLVVVESSVYALFFGAGVTMLMRAFGLDALLAIPALSIADLSVTDRFVLAIGAGLYEELVFRLVLLGGLYVVATRVLRMNKVIAGLAAVIISSVLFSAVHHMGNMADEFQLGVFLFRLFAGVLLSVIFWLRGLAVAVYTHAIYDVIVMVFRS